QHGEQVVRVERAVNQRLAGADVLAFLHVDVDAAGDQVLLDGAAVLALDRDLALSLGHFPVFHDAVDFADDGGVAGLARLEQLDDAREAAGDVLRLGGLAGDFGQHVAGMDVVAIGDHEVGARGHEVLFPRAARGVADEHGGLVLLVARRQRNDELGKSGDLVHLLFDGDAGLEVLELDGAADLGEDGEGVGVPFADDLADGDRHAFRHLEVRAIHEVMAFFFAALVVHHGDEAGAVHGDEVAVAALDRLHVNELDEAGTLDLDLGLLGDAGGGAADVEGAHGELRAGLADGLRADDAHGLAHLDHASGGQIAAIAAGADAAAGFAGEHGADFDALDARGLNGAGQFLADVLVDLADHIAFVVLEAFEGDAADHAVAQGLDFHAGLEDGLHVNAFGSAAVEFADDHVLGHVHQAAGEVAGVGGLERGVRQALARAVRGDEVLEDGEALAEVGSDGGLDDLAGRLGHEAAHAGKLADLLLGAAGAGVSHDVDGVDDALLIALLEDLEHFFGDFFGDVAPDGDDLVVGLADELFLFRRDDHVVDADGDAGLGGVEEAQFLELVEHAHGEGLAEAQVGVLHQELQALFLEQAVDERHALGQMVVEDHAADGGVDELAGEHDGLRVSDVLVVEGGAQVNHLA